MAVESEKIICISSSTRCRSRSVTWFTFLACLPTPSSSYPSVSHFIPSFRLAWLIRLGSRCFAWFTGPASWSWCCPISTFDAFLTTLTPSSWCPFWSSEPSRNPHTEQLLLPGASSCKSTYRETWSMAELFPAAANIFTRYAMRYLLQLILLHLFLNQIMRLLLHLSLTDLPVLIHLLTLLPMRKSQLLQLHKLPLTAWFYRYPISCKFRFLI